MGAADGDRPFQAHQFAQHLGPADDRKQALTGGLDLRVGGLDSGRRHHHPGVAQVLFAVADMYRNAQVAKPLDIGAVAEIAALH